MPKKIIYAEDAIDALRVAYWDENIQSAKDDPCIVDAMTDWAIRQIKALPSAQPQRMKGKWIDCSSSEHYKCSVCGYRTGFWLEDNDTLTEWLSNFCPNCGAEMWR